jgi:hypothetical protein
MPRSGSTNPWQAFPWDCRKMQPFSDGPRGLSGGCHRGNPGAIATTWAAQGSNPSGFGSLASTSRWSNGFVGKGHVHSGVSGRRALGKEDLWDFRRLWSKSGNENHLSSGRTKVRSEVGEAGLATREAGFGPFSLLSR